MQKRKENIIIGKINIAAGKREEQPIIHVDH
jgi:hypothetical protein